MRWLFLLLVVLNAFYYVWHQQEAPLKAKEVMPLSLYKGNRQGIQLLSESAREGASEVSQASSAKPAECLFVGGVSALERMEALEQRLLSLDITAKPVGKIMDNPGFWVRISEQNRDSLDEAMLRNLSRDFKELKHKIMLCEGVASFE
ncbi:hypothetical protein [Pseudomonas sp. R5(2019)]|uniref:hypothetical protein n=1 Tax=Pseudomonas sp. R5(2019) TaxID=2697566 RepID=UPI0014120EE5|nr:hypothetical protein [Pseudomonas sp. R5(2019)]NBA96177.1 hypothetical protein [Pseudomonas sp. R5(2019)]